MAAVRSGGAYSSGVSSWYKEFRLLLEGNKNAAQRRICDELRQILDKIINKKNHICGRTDGCGSEHIAFDLDRI